VRCRQDKLKADVRCNVTGHSAIRLNSADVLDEIGYEFGWKLAYIARELERTSNQFGFIHLRRRIHDSRNIDSCQILATGIGVFRWGACRLCVRISYPRWNEQAQPAAIDHNQPACSCFNSLARESHSVTLDY
jgi:hypothetical protein